MRVVSNPKKSKVADQTTETILYAITCFSVRLKTLHVVWRWPLEKARTAKAQWPRDLWLERECHMPLLKYSLLDATFQSESNHPKYCQAHQNKAVIGRLCRCCLACLNNWCLLEFCCASSFNFQISLFFSPHLCCSWFGLHRAWRKVTTFGLPLITLRHARN